MLEIAVYLTVGVLAGFVAGLLGVGGGLLIVPALAMLLVDHSSAYAMHLAIATSLATIVLTGLSSVYAHHRRGAVQWRLVAWLAPGLLLGAWLGATAASALSGVVLAKIFGTFCLVTGLQLWREPPVDGPARPVPEPLLSGAGVAIGAASALVGIGGGSLTVPFLIWRGQLPVRAVATAAAGGVPIALAGTAGFVWAGRGVSLPDATLGFVYLPALLGIAATSVLTAPLGARLAHQLPQQALRRAFALFLWILGGFMLLR